MKSREIPVKLSRVIILFGIISAGIIALGVLVGAFFAVEPALDTVCWHLQHGNKVAFDGHAFHLPLMWSATPEPATNGLLIHRAYGGAIVDLTSTGLVLDPAAAKAWQEQRIALFNAVHHDPEVGQEMGRLLRGKNLELVCVDNGSESPGITGLLDCRIINTDLQALVLTDARHQSELQSILDSSK
jgi:hypothetical protein